MPAGGPLPFVEGAVVECVVVGVSVLFLLVALVDRGVGVHYRALGVAYFAAPVRGGSRFSAAAAF